ncbi:anti-anti-sigma factor [candidate division LCP-89 bacterium B3_LCP]|uniref:Anti-sigma factor antagonist n=1 Tax=candidate division LCP-89 bacterium B3_LCP TaxID=2012998 RepID=A0A532V559_UNCL8|nr:MAG: anti-anti-sigma factor [candidate division LCP-89 bacterium B3_LCP]
MSGMTLEINEFKDGAVFHMGGRVMFETDSSTFQQKLSEMLDHDKKWVVIDLSQVVAMSSTGLGILIAAHRTITEKNCSFKLAKLSEKVRSIIQITRLDTIFEIFESVDDAMAESD